MHRGDRGSNIRSWSSASPRKPPACQDISIPCVKQIEPYTTSVSHPERCQHLHGANYSRADAYQPLRTLQRMTGAFHQTLQQRSQSTSSRLSVTLRNACGEGRSRRTQSSAAHLLSPPSGQITSTGAAMTTAIRRIPSSSRGAGCLKDIATARFDPIVIWPLLLKRSPFKWYATASPESGRYCCGGRLVVFKGKHREMGGKCICSEPSSMHTSGRV